jgi:hypothetical protein
MFLQLSAEQILGVVLIVCAVIVIVRLAWR